MISQKEYTYNVVREIYGEIEGKVELSSEQRSQCIGMICEGIMNKEVMFSDNAWTKYDTEDKVKKYCSSLLTNHLKKDKRLNGGIKYVPANPGSRRESTDPVIKTLKLFIQSLDEGDERIEVAQQEIDARMAEIEAEKKKQQVTIDVDLLPDELREKLGLEEEQSA